MRLFKKKTPPALIPPEYTLPVIRSSICTGEQVAGFKNPANGKFMDVCVIRNTQDLQNFAQVYGLRPESIKKEY